MEVFEMGIKSSSSTMGKSNQVVILKLIQILNLFEIKVLFLSWELICSFFIQLDVTSQFFSKRLSIASKRQKNEHFSLMFLFS